MNSSTPDEPVYDAQCIVCLKTVRENDSSICRFNFDGRWVTACCPLCFEALQADPTTYLSRKLPPRQDNPSIGPAL
jgi:hypothetical protein